MRRMQISLALALVFVVAIIFKAGQVEAGVIDDLEQQNGLTDEELQEILSEYPGGVVSKRDGRYRRGRPRFCLPRDYTCPDLPNGDICCNGSQCSCNLFGQNCRCSPIGLFQRLG